jgi:DivIVA domain-containing protein
LAENSKFAVVSGRGYNPKQVDALFDLAKRQYENPNLVLVRASDLRGLRLGLVRGGYATNQVDAALDNLEDHFIKTEVAAFRERFGGQELTKRYSELRDALIPRLKREKAQRFTKVSVFSRGYDKKKVDALCDQLLGHFESSSKLKVGELRRVQFSSTRLGYSMPQVDSFIDRAIEAMQLEITE